MAEAHIHYNLDLIVELLDTTTGIVIPEREVIFKLDGNVVAMHRKAPGVYILLNHGRNDAELFIHVKSYADVTVPVQYDRLSKQYPTIEAPMVPVVLPYGYTDLCSLKGEMKGISDISAISLTDFDAKFGDYNAKKGSIRLFSSRRLGENDYAIFHEENMEFEEFRIVKKAADGLLLTIKDTLKMPCMPEEGIARIVRGITDANGRYLLRVRKDGRGTKYLVRYIVDGMTKFEKIEFGKDTERRLGQWEQQ